MPLFLRTSAGGGAGTAQVLTRTSVKTGNYTAALWDLVPCDTSAGAFTVTLPAASGGKGRIALKLVTAGNALNLALTGADKFNTSAGSTSGTLTLTNQGILAESDGSGIWTVTADDIPLTGLDARFARGGGPFKAALYQSNSNAINYSDNSEVAGRLCFTPIDIGPVTWPIDAVAIQLFGTPASGGSGLTFGIGLYADDGTGFPDGAAAVFTTVLPDAALRTGSTTVVSVLGSPVTPPRPGRYWVATLYNYATAPSTAPKLVGGYNATPQLSSTLGGLISPTHFYTASGQSSLPTATLTKSSFTTDNNVPAVVGFRRG